MGGWAKLSGVAGMFFGRRGRMEHKSSPELCGAHDLRHPLSPHAPCIRHSPGPSGLPQTAGPGFFLPTGLFEFSRTTSSHHFLAPFAVGVALFPRWFQPRECGTQGRSGVCQRAGLPGGFRIAADFIRNILPISVFRPFREGLWRLRLPPNRRGGRPEWGAWRRGGTVLVSGRWRGRSGPGGPALSRYWPGWWRN